MGMSIGDVVAYHVTSKAAASEIKKNGLKTRSSKQSYDRPAAVYFFLDIAEIDNANRAILLGDPNDFEIIKVRIPRREFLANTAWDGLYDVSFGESISAIQYLADVPVDWII